MAVEHTVIHGPPRNDEYPRPRLTVRRQRKNVASVMPRFFNRRHD